MICGIEIKANEAILVLCNIVENELMVCANEFKKIDLGGNGQEAYKSFYSTLSSFVKQNEIERIYLKRPIDKGRQLSGPNAFRVEAIINLLDVPVSTFHVNTVSTFCKKNELKVKNKEALNKYQEGALWTVYCGFIKELQK